MDIFPVSSGIVFKILQAQKACCYYSVLFSINSIHVPQLNTISTITKKTKHILDEIIGSSPY